MSNAIIIRAEKQQNYSIMNNQIGQTINISCRAIGLYHKLMTLPPEWNYSISGLAKICKESEATIQSMLKELQEFGYIEINKKYPSKETKGRIQFEYILHETSIAPEKLETFVEWSKILKD